MNDGFRILYQLYLQTICLQWRITDDDDDDEKDKKSFINPAHQRSGRAEYYFYSCPSVRVCVQKLEKNNLSEIDVARQEYFAVNSRNNLISVTFDLDF